MTNNGYKKYMKKSAQSKDYSLLKIFALSFFGMLLVFTILIKSFSPTVDVSIGDYKKDQDIPETIVNVDDRLAAIQDEDRGRDFSEIMKRASDVQTEPEVKAEPLPVQEDKPKVQVRTLAQDPMYKVYIGSYTSAEQAKVAKDIIQESGTNLNPIVKCIGSNNYTLQVGIFKSKAGAEALLSTVQQNHLPGRIVQEY